MRIEPGHLRVLADYEKLHRGNDGVVSPTVVRDTLFAVVSTLIWNGERPDPLVDRIGTRTATGEKHLNPAPTLREVRQGEAIARARSKLQDLMDRIKTVRTELVGQNVLVAVVELEKLDKILAGDF